MTICKSIVVLFLPCLVGFLQSHSFFFCDLCIYSLPCFGTVGQGGQEQPLALSYSNLSQAVSDLGALRPTGRCENLHLPKVFEGLLIASPMLIHLSPIM